MTELKNIRNFAILAHIDHGKSTLADRLLELTGAVEKRKMREQYLDQMDLEREKGITIKLQPVRMAYKMQNVNIPGLAKRSGAGKNQNDNEKLKINPAERDTKILNFDFYTLNLIDTPGHVDFSYEVSRSLAAVEGAILLVDATKGVQAQTLANLYLAKEQNLKIIPAINKIDLPGARVKEAEEQIREILGDSNAEIYKISAKEGKGVEELLQAVIQKIPAPQVNINQPLRALIFDSVYDAYKGVLAYVRIVDGQIKAGEKIFLIGSHAQSEVLEVGIFKPALTQRNELGAGDIGYIATGFKDVSLCRVGDTITNFHHQARNPLAGYKEPRPMVFASFYPSADAEYDHLKDSLNKLKLNDAALVFEPESSEALGRGFKCGFLGMLHLEIISERLKREYGLDLIVTTPSVAYQIIEKSGHKEKTIYSAEEMPDPSRLEQIKEPWIKLEIICPNVYLGAIMKLVQSSGGVYKNTQYLGSERFIFSCEAPLREIIVDFYDRLKSVSSGYASMSYEILEWRSADLVKMDVLVAGDKESSLSRIVPRERVFQEGRALVSKLKEVLPKQMFAVSLQAALGGKIIARETIAAMRKDVTGYLYGGDYSRKRKLLEKQKRGKKKMKSIGKIKIPQNVFLEILKK
ncbi:MAG: elongation factor 4 [Candidatus Portnoybacteria bacterium]|nr:elongation factor 4 [Candidatus Portnoybacteria bacterium]